MEPRYAPTPLRPWRSLEQVLDPSGISTRWRVGWAKLLQTTRPAEVRVALGTGGAAEFLLAHFKSGEGASGPTPQTEPVWGPSSPCLIRHSPADRGRQVLQLDR